MYRKPKLKVEVVEDARALVITLPGTKYQITYRKMADIPGMSGAHDLPRDDPDASLNRYEFLARAWRIANAKHENSAGLFRNPGSFDLSVHRSTLAMSASAFVSRPCYWPKMLIPFFHESVV